jgi:hypothetical protein
MTTNNQDLMCGDAATLVGYLYGECDALERVRMERHLETCDVCATELTELGSARQYLSAWTPPEAALGFRIATERPAPVAPIRLAWWRQPMPAWGQAVAAVALFGLGLGVGSRSIGGSIPGATESTQSARATVSAEALAQLETRMKEEIAALRNAPAAPAPAPARAPSGADEEAILRQVRQLIRESEGRQEEAFTVRAAQLARDAEIQRRVDQAQLQQTFSQMQGTTSEEVRRQREMLNYLVNVSQRR